MPRHKKSSVRKHPLANTFLNLEVHGIVLAATGFASCCTAAAKVYPKDSRAKCVNMMQNIFMPFYFTARALQTHRSDNGAKVPNKSAQRGTAIPFANRLELAVGATVPTNQKPGERMHILSTYLVTWFCCNTKSLQIKKEIVSSMMRKSFVHASSE